MYIDFYEPQFCYYGYVWLQALCIGAGWLAVATDRRLVRLFTVTGVQREMFSIPGPVVAMAGQGELLMLVYHQGPGLPGDQSLAVMVLQVSGRRRAILNGSPLPIAHKSTLAWLGLVNTHSFTAF